MAKRNWYALYTTSRWEKKVHRLLQEAGYESYCPLHMVLRRWSDRTKKVEEPLFKSYVFVRLYEKERQAVRDITGVVNFVHWLHKPAIIRDEEIEEIRRFLGEYDHVEVVKMPEVMEPGEKIRITGGVFMHHEAIVLRTHNKSIELQIESLGLKLVATLDRRYLEKI